MVKKIIGFAIALVICNCIVAQPITVKGYGDKSLTITGPYNIDAHIAVGTIDEFITKQSFKVNDNNIEILTYEYSPNNRGNGASGKSFVQSMQKVVCYFPDIDIKNTKIRKDFGKDEGFYRANNIVAEVELLKNSDGIFYNFQCANKNKIEGSTGDDYSDYSEYIERNSINYIVIGFTSLAKAEAFKKMLDEKLFDYALNLDAPVIQKPFEAYNLFSEDYPNGQLAKADADVPTETEAENPILTEGSKLELNTGTYYKYKEVVYNEKMEKLFINRGKDLGVYGGSSTLYTVEGDYLKGSKLLKNGKFLYFIYTNIYYDEGKQNMFLSIFGSTIKKGNKQVGTAKNNFKTDSQGNNTFKAVDIAVLVDLVETALK